MACRGGEAKAGQTQWQHRGVEHWGVCTALGGGHAEGGLSLTTSCYAGLIEMQKAGGEHMDCGTWDEQRTQHAGEGAWTQAASPWKNRNMCCLQRC